MQTALGYTLALFLAVGTFFSGVQLGQGTAGSGQTASLFDWFSQGTSLAAAPNTDLDQFWEVWNVLDDKFAAATSSALLSEEEKIQGAIAGLVRAYGDPYTVYLPPADSADFAADISGEFSGVGMEVGMRDGYITVIAPLPETPAMQAGLLAGDLITQIDGESTQDMSIDQAVDRIRGPRGTVVTLTVYREGAMEFQDIAVTRDTITIPTVATKQVGDTFIIELYSFNALAEQLVGEALADYIQSDAQTLVIDVRGNPGGFLESAVGIASFFLPSGKVVVQESFLDESNNDVFRSTGRQAAVFTPETLVVLVDGGSASASEILAGALQDHGVATVIGEQTFGKGSVQELVELRDGSSVKVTIARWLTPNGVSISDGGLPPDIVISRTPEQRIADEDPQQAAAVRFLAGEVVESEVVEDTLFDEAPAGGE